LIINFTVSILYAVPVTAYEKKNAAKRNNTVYREPKDQRDTLCEGT